MAKVNSHSVFFSFSVECHLKFTSISNEWKRERDLKERLGLKGVPISSRPFFPYPLPLPRAVNERRGG